MMWARERGWAVQQSEQTCERARRQITVRCSSHLNTVRTSTPLPLSIHRRVTAGEMVVGHAQVLMLDEITNGLDAASALTICKALRSTCEQANVSGRLAAVIK